MRAHILVFAILLLSLSLSSLSVSASTLLRGQGESDEVEAAVAPPPDPNSLTRIRGIVVDTTQFSPIIYLCVSAPPTGGYIARVYMDLTVAAQTVFPGEPILGGLKPTQKANPNFFNLAYFASQTSVRTVRLSDLATLERNSLSYPDPYNGTPGLALSADEKNIFSAGNIYIRNLGSYNLQMNGFEAPSLSTLWFGSGVNSLSNSISATSNGATGTDPNFVYFARFDGTSGVSNYTGAFLQLNRGDGRYGSVSASVELPSGVGQSGYVLQDPNQKDVAFVVSNRGYFASYSLGKESLARTANISLASALDETTDISGGYIVDGVAYLITSSNAAPFVVPRSRIISVDVKSNPPKLINVTGPGSNYWWTTLNLTAVSGVSGDATAPRSAQIFVATFQNGTPCVFSLIVPTLYNGVNQCYTTFV